MASRLRIAPTVTLFANQLATHCVVHQLTPAALEQLIRNAEPVPSKADCAWLKLAEFGDQRSGGGSLRHDANVRAVHGVIADYDGEQMPMQDAVEKLRAAGLCAVLYTSASHVPERPRWRAIVFLSKPLEGTTQELREQHRHWTGVLNALLGGVLKSESFALSQSYYFGPVAGRPEPEVVRLSGVCVDQMPKPPAPVFSINGHEHKSAKLDGRDTSRSTDLDFKVRCAIEASKSDVQIHGEFDSHPHAASKGNGAHRAVQRCIDRWRNKIAADTSTTAAPFDFRKHKSTVQGLLDTPPTKIEFLQEDILARGASSLLVGRPKNFKSTLAAQLGLAQCGNPELVKDWAGFSRISGKRRVAIIDLEQSEQLAASLFARFGVKHAKGFLRFDTWPKFDQAGIDALRGLIVTERLDLIIVDSLTRIMPQPPRGLSAFAAEAEAMQRVTALAHETGCHILTIAHQGKRDAVDDPLISIAGTSALPASVDDVLVLYKDGDDQPGGVRRKLFIAGRHIAKAGVYILDKKDHESRFVLKGDESIVVRGELRQGVVRLLNNRDGVPMTPKQLADALGGDRRNVHRALQSLVQERIVLALDGGKYSTPFIQAKARVDRRQGKRGGK